MILHKHRLWCLWQISCLWRGLVFIFMGPICKIKFLPRSACNDIEAITDKIWNFSFYLPYAMSLVKDFTIDAENHPWGCNLPEVFPEKAVDGGEEAKIRWRLQSAAGGLLLSLMARIRRRWWVCQWPRGLGSRFHRRVAGLFKLLSNRQNQIISTSIVSGYPKERLWQTQRWT